MFPISSARIAPAVGVLSMAGIFAFGGVVQATSVPVFSYGLAPDALKASVTGDARTGVWRIRMVAPSGDRRIDFVLRSGDMAWSGQVRVSQKLGNSWSLVSRRTLDESLAGGAPLAACNAGVCWSTAGLRLPRDGDARFGVTVTLSRTGTYQISGGVRQATEAFIYGSWLTSASRSVTHLAPQTY